MRPGNGNRIGIPLLDGRAVPAKKSGADHRTWMGRPARTTVKSKQLKPYPAATLAVARESGSCKVMKSMVILECEVVSSPWIAVIGHTTRK